MPIENQPGLLETWENIQRQKDNITGAEMARVLREQYGDEPTSQFVKLSPPPINTTRGFLVNAIHEGAHLKKPHGLSLESWILTRNLVGSYFLTDTSMAKVTVAYGLSNPDISRRIKYGLMNIWENSPDYIKAQFPLSRITQSKKQNLIDMVSKGIPIEEIMHKLEISNNTLIMYRSLLKDYIDIPHLPRADVRARRQPKLHQASQPRPQRTESLPQGHELHPALKQVLESKETPLIYASSKMRSFLQVCLAEGVFNQKPQKYSEDSWVKKRNMLGVYFSSVATNEDLGRIYNLSRERIRQLIAETLTDFHIALPAKIKLQYPFHDILSSQGKTRTQVYRDLLSGEYNNLVSLSEQGVDIPEMAKSLGLSTGNVRKRLSVLIDFGLDIPLKIVHPNLENKRVANTLQDTSLDDKSVQELFDKITRGLYGVYRKSDEPIIIPVSEVAKEYGFHSITRNGPKFIQALKDAHLPTGTVKSEVKTGPQKGLRNYFFIVSWHKERAGQILLETPNLKRFLENPVQQVYGPNSLIPTTWEISSSNTSGIYRSISRVFAEFGVRMGERSKLKPSNFFNDDCPVPIFKHRDYYIYPSDKEIELKSFIKQRLEELGH